MNTDQRKVTGTLQATGSVMIVFRWFVNMCVMTAAIVFPVAVLHVKNQTKS